MTILIIIITCIISIICFSNRALFSKLQFNAYQVFEHKQVYRVISHGFVHVNWGHLMVNMFVLYFFGGSLEAILFGLKELGLINFPILLYLLFYFSALIISTSISLFRYKHTQHYNAVGASGAVSAVLFFSIFFNPWENLYLYAVIKIPGIVFAILYIMYSQYMIKHGHDNTAHEAHLMGAAFGFVFPLFIDLSLLSGFINQLLSVLK